MIFRNVGVIMCNSADELSREEEVVMRAVERLGQQLSSLPPFLRQLFKGVLLVLTKDTTTASQMNGEVLLRESDEPCNTPDRS